MASSQPLRDLLTNSALEPLLQTLQKPPFKVIDIGWWELVFGVELFKNCSWSHLNF